jgi:predicted ATPase/DNA-binding CsgD family transcriptional regulator
MSAGGHQVTDLSLVGATLTLLSADDDLDLTGCGATALDGCHAFARASDAALAAVRLRSEHPQVRMGLHTGEVEGADSRAAVLSKALCATAQSGQTLLSSVTHDVVADHLPEGVPLVDLGEHRVVEHGRPVRVWQLGAGAFPRAVWFDAPPTNLPPRLTSFVGRTAELEDLTSRLPTARLLTLTGAGGCGKTRLAIQVADRLSAHYPDGVWFCDLGPISRSELVVGTLAEVLGTSDQLGADSIQVVTARLAKARALVLLDNCEHVIDACAELVEALLRGCPDLTVLATSREPLGVDGEVAWRVPSLSLPPADVAGTVEELLEFDAVRLFVERARTGRPNFAVDDATAVSVLTLCQRLDGIPLALELAASRVRVLSVEQIVQGLDDRFHLLGAGPRNTLPRQQTLQASVDWSYELLGESERILLRRLAVFSGGFDLDAAEEVCSGEGLDRLDVLDVLARLVDRSLVGASEREADGRYRLLETIRHDSLRRLVDAHEAIVVRGRHRDHFARLAIRGHDALLRGAADEAALAEWCVREADNLRDALRSTMASSDTAEKLRFVEALDQVWWRKRGTYRDAVGWYEQALEDQDGPAELRAACLAWLAMHQTRLGDLAAALRSAEAAVDAAPGEGEAACSPLLALAIVLSNSGHRDRSREMVLRAATAMAGVPRERIASPHTFAFLSHASLFQGDIEGGQSLLDEGLALARRLRHHEAQATNLFWLATLNFGEGRFDDAEAKLSECYAIAREGWSQEMENQALVGLAEVAARRGDYERARVLLADQLRKTDDVGLWPSFMHGALAEIAWARGSLGEARAHLARSFIPVGKYRLTHAHVALSEGVPDEARSALDEVDLTDESTLPLVLCVRGRLERAEGDLGASEATHHEAIRAWHPTSLQYAFVDTVIDNVEALAGLAAVGGRALESARLMGAAAALRDDVGYVRFPVLQAGYDDDLGLVRAALEADDLDAAWAAGASMSLDELVAYVQRGRGQRRRATAGWDALTPAETEVVRLAARGLTNPEIAERLFVARSTVKVHLSHVFAKLGFSTRAELAAEAARRGV